MPDLSGHIVGLGRRLDMPALPPRTWTAGEPCEGTVMAVDGQPSSDIAPSWNSRRSRQRDSDVVRLLAQIHAQATELGMRLDTVPLTTAPAVLAVLRTITRALHDAEGLLALRLLEQAAVAPPRTPEAFISIADAAQRVGRSPRWVYRHKEHLPFVRRDGPRGLRASVHDLEKYLRTRPTLANSY